MGGGIVTLSFFQALCETSNHLAPSSSAHEKKAPLFVCTVGLVEWFEVLAGILGYLITLQCYFQCCFYKDNLLWLYALALKMFIEFFREKCLNSGCFYKGSLPLRLGSKNVH